MIRMIWNIRTVIAALGVGIPLWGGHPLWEILDPPLKTLVHVPQRFWHFANLKHHNIYHTSRFSQLEMRLGLQSCPLHLRSIHNLQIWSITIYITQVASLNLIYFGTTPTYKAYTICKFEASQCISHKSLLSIRYAIGTTKLPPTTKYTQFVFYKAQDIFDGPFIILHLSRTNLYTSFPCWYETERSQQIYSCCSSRSRKGPKGNGPHQPWPNMF